MKLPDEPTAEAAFWMQSWSWSALILHILALVPFVNSTGITWWFDLGNWFINSSLVRNNKTYNLHRQQLPQPVYIVK